MGLKKQNNEKAEARELRTHLLCGGWMSAPSACIS